MIKVLIATNKFVNGGVETTLLRILKNIDTSKYEITVGICCKGGELEKEIPDNIRVQYLLSFDPMELPRLISNVYQLTLLMAPGVVTNRLFIKDKYDVVVAYSGNMIYYLKGFKGKKICWLHDDWFPFKIQNHIIGKIRKRRTVRVLQHCSKIVCVSNQLKEMLEQWSGMLLNNVMFLPNPIDIEGIRRFGEQEVDYCFDKEILYLVSVGRLHPIKGYTRLIKICAELHQKYKGYKLLIIGAGEEENNLKELIRELQAEDYIELMGYTGNPHCYVKNCDVFVCSSKMEGYSTAISEAMILGKAIVSTDCGGSEQILDYGKYGILVENSSDGIKKGIIKILENQELVAYYQKMATIRAEEIFSLHEAVNRITDLF